MEKNAKIMLGVGSGILVGCAVAALVKRHNEKKTANIAGLVAGTLTSATAVVLILLSEEKKREATQLSVANLPGLTKNDMWYHIGQNTEKSRFIYNHKTKGISWVKDANTTDVEVQMVKKIAFEIMNTNTEAGKRISYLQNSKNTSVIIKISKTGKTETNAENWEKACNGDGTTAFVSINILDVKKYREGIEKDLRASFVHEVAGHAYSFCNGTSTYRGDGKGTWQGLCIEEQKAVAMENEIRNYYSLPQREKYQDLWDMPIFDAKTNSWFLRPGEFDFKGGYRTLQGPVERWGLQ